MFKACFFGPYIERSWSSFLTLLNNNWMLDIKYYPTRISFNMP